MTDFNDAQLLALSKLVLIGIIKERDAAFRREVADHSRTKIKAHGMYEQATITRKQNVKLRDLLESAGLSTKRIL